ncbi:MAG: hypothetical protein IPM51_13485 [Sphingobacteriaceae bacterium]|nr:hypothetical protein [Sphingobacteriaceae bacterium]
MNRLIIFTAFTLLIFISCKKKETETENTPSVPTPVPEYNNITLTLTAIDLVGGTNTYTFNGNPVCKITYQGSTIDSLILNSSIVSYTSSSTDSLYCINPTSTYTTVNKSFKLKNGVDNNIEFWDNAGMISKYKISDQGLWITVVRSTKPGYLAIACSGKLFYGIKAL